MARFTRCARAAGVTYLHFETVGPTVPCPVPGRFDGGPMGWASVVSCWLAGGCRRARHGSLIGHHRGESTLHVLDGLGEGGVRCDEVVDGGVLLNGHIGWVVCLFHLHGLVGAEGGFACCHAGDVVHFGECSRPVDLLQLISIIP